MLISLSVLMGRFCKTSFTLPHLPEPSSNLVVLTNMSNLLSSQQNEANQQGQAMEVPEPHIKETYEDKTVFDDAASIIIHNMKRQSSTSLHAMHFALLCLLEDGGGGGLVIEKLHG